MQPAPASRSPAKAARVALNYMNITNPVGDGVDVTNSAAAANVTLTGTQITLSGTQTGVSVANNSGTLNANSVTVTGGGVGLNVGGSSGTENVDSFTATNAATGINLATNTGTFNATGTTTVNGSTVNGVDLATVSGPTTFGTLNISATTGTGLLATNQTGLLTISAGTITASDGTGVNIDNSATTAAPLAVTLTAVNATGGTNGINLNTAAGTFSVSSGTISGTTGQGIFLVGVNGTSAGSISLGGITITNPAGPGVEAVASSNFTLNQLTIDTHTTGAVGIELLDDAGAVTVSNNNISYGNSDGIFNQPTSAGTTYHFDSNVLTTSGTGTANGIITVDLVGGNNIDESGNSINLSTATFVRRHRSCQSGGRHRHAVEHGEQYRHRRYDSVQLPRSHDRHDRDQRHSGAVNGLPLFNGRLIRGRASALMKRWQAQGWPPTIVALDGVSLAFPGMIAVASYRIRSPPVVLP